MKRPARGAPGFLRILLRSALSLFVIPAAVCSAAGSDNFFPIGLYQVGDPKGLPALREEGFNSVQSYTGDLELIQSLALAAKKEKMRLLIYPQTVMASSWSPRGFPLAAWQLFDEPDRHGLKPAELRALDERVRRWSPETPTAFVLGDGRRAAEYSEAGDILMVDWYPVPHLPLVSAGEHVRWAVEASRGKPVWAVLQAMDWRWVDGPAPAEARKVGRFPTRGELRFMSYHAILEGARGIWYFAHSFSGRPLSDKPELWFALTSVSRELAALRPVFERGRLREPPAAALACGLAARAWRYRFRDYLILLNKGQTSIPLPAEFLAPRWRPLFELRRDPRDFLPQKEGQSLVEPYRVLILESRLGGG